MNKVYFKLAKLAVLITTILWISGCISIQSTTTTPAREQVRPVANAQSQQIKTNLSQFPRVNKWVESRAITNPLERDYYGADLTQFPPQVRRWVINTGFPKENMEKPFMIDPKLRAWWSDDNNSVLFEASYTVAPGYKGAGTRTTWGQGARYGGSSNIFNMYGKHARFQTLRFKWELTQEVESLLRNDPMFAEIIEFAMKLSEEIEYDWASFKGYKGPVKRTPGLRYAVCSGYADEVMEKALSLNSVQAVQRWASPGHAWNVLKLTDGRTLYFDLTWFDNEHINQETGRIFQTEDYGWANITFNEELFRFSNIGYGTNVFHHNMGKFDRERKR